MWPLQALETMEIHNSLNKGILSLVAPVALVVFGMPGLDSCDSWLSRFHPYSPWPGGTHTQWASGLQWEKTKPA